MCTWPVYACQAMPRGVERESRGLRRWRAIWVESKMGSGEKVYKENGAVLQLQAVHLKKGLNRDVIPRQVRSLRDATFFPGHMASPILLAASNRRGCVTSGAAVDVARSHTACEGWKRPLRNVMLLRMSWIP